ncbi:hypothetical protein SKAU_G00015100 [Synaphobranchus kaupii]|uniref:Gypsy retrotransposon integrase-like protein 1 n=1 Tax=Synaphobranchus kaupii TaxID=118154 RepID=A0A9Q1GCJ8_SYNKA|nr:hypothetical protein SKAU_G00015100 [Synaphobranchus kaupii]
MPGRGCLVVLHQDRLAPYRPLATHLMQLSRSGMERALLREIGELERSIGELTRRKARRAGAVMSPEWQTPALAAQLGGWTPEQTAGHLALALEGPALEAILDLLPAERQNLQALTAALQRRFIQHRSAEASREKLLSRYRCEEESWGKVAVDVQRYAREAYPEFDAAAQEKLALHAFLRALRPERLRDHVSLAQPGSISEALIKTTRAEDTLAIWPTPQPTRQHIRVADGEEVRWTRTPLQRPAGRQGRCYRCDEPGRLGKASGLYLHCRLDGQACQALVDTGATIILVWPGVFHNTGGPQLPGGQHHPWHGDCSPLIRPDTKTGPTSPPPSHHSPASKQATPASHRTQATVTDHSAPARPLARPPPPACHTATACPAQTSSACRDDSSCPRPVATKQQRARPQQPQQLKSLLDGNADLFAVRDEDCTQTELVQHTINTDTAQPIRLRPHRMSPAKRLVAEEKVKEMAAAGVIEPSDSPWAAPAVLVQKKSGEWRFCVDYRHLNSATTKDSYPLPRIDEALDHISGSSWFSSLDLRSGYWQEGQYMAFDQLRAALTEAPVLAYHDAQRPFIIDTDASNTGVGAVLRELLAVVRALHHFRPYLQGSHFLLRTDHASLTWLLNFKDPEGQVARWLEQLQGYDFKIRHRAGRLHWNADALSRRPCAAQECSHCSRLEERDQVSPDVAVVQASGDAEGWLPLTPMELQEAQEADSMLGKVRGWLEAGQRPERSVVSAESPELKSYYSLYSSLVQRDGLLYRRWQAPGRGSDILQLLVPRALRPDVLRLVHGSVGVGHFGNNKTLHQLRGKFHWPGCRHNVELHVHSCDSCMAQKGPNQRSRAPLQQHLVGAPMERVGVDVLGPFPVTDSGNRYILVAMDYFTSSGRRRSLYQTRVRRRRRKGSWRKCSPVSGPLPSSTVSRGATSCPSCWLRSAVQESSQLTPAALMFGRELRTPVDLVFGALPEPEEPSRTREEYYHRLRDRLLVAHDFARKAQASAGFKQKRWYDTRCRGQAFAAGEQVWVYCPERKKGLSPKLRASWRGPGEVVERLSEVVYRIRMPGRGRLVVLHQDRLAPYRPLATPDAAEPEVSSDTALPSEPEPSDTLLSATGRPKRHRQPPGHLRDFDVSCGWTAGSSGTCDPLGGGNVAAWGL